MKKYKAKYSGFVYVMAESAEEALDMAQDGDADYEEKHWEHAKEVYEFCVSAEG